VTVFPFSGFKIDLHFGEINLHKSAYIETKRYSRSENNDNKNFQVHTYNDRIMNQTDSFAHQCVIIDLLHNINQLFANGSEFFDRQLIQQQLNIGSELF
jgi:hypothetical protein